MVDELDVMCHRLRMLIVELEPAMPRDEWVDTGFFLADVIAALRSMDAERAFWAAPDDDEDEGSWGLE